VEGALEEVEAFKHRESRLQKGDLLNARQGSGDGGVVSGRGQLAQALFDDGE
jgi:hypothetical protein